MEYPHKKKDTNLENKKADKFAGLLILVILHL